jgi:hypothetical protein
MSHALTDSQREYVRLRLDHVDELLTTINDARARDDVRHIKHTVDEMRGEFGLPVHDVAPREGPSATAFMWADVLELHPDHIDTHGTLPPDVRHRIEDLASRMEASLHDLEEHMRGSRNRASPDTST